MEGWSFPYISSLKILQKKSLNSFRCSLNFQTIFLVFQSGGLSVSVVLNGLLTVIYLFTFGGFALWSFECSTDRSDLSKSRGVFENKVKQVDVCVMEYLKSMRLGQSPSLSISFFGLSIRRSGLSGLPRWFHQHSPTQLCGGETTNRILTITDFCPLSFYFINISHFFSIMTITNDARVILCGFEMEGWIHVLQQAIAYITRKRTRNLVLFLILSWSFLVFLFSCIAREKGWGPYQTVGWDQHHQ